LHVPNGLNAGGAINTPLFADWASALYPFNLTGHPAASVPCGFTAHGLPIGLQLVAPWDQEARIHGVAAFFEAMAPWAHRRPPV
jgi:aspartyl-tRNA(Asn)/glutamyl-tRNA(Gln) amidotransferase subunit A